MSQQRFSSADFLPSSPLVQLYEQAQAEGRVPYLDTEDFEHIIEHYLGHNLLDQALAVVEQAMNFHVYALGLYIYKAQILSMNNNLDEALYWIERGLTYHPGEFEALTEHIRLLIQATKLEEAMQGVEKALLQCSEETERLKIYLLEAEISMSLGDYQTALETYWEILRQDADHEEALGKAWLCIEIAELYDLAISPLNQIIDQAPYSSWAWYYLGHCYFKLGLWERSVEFYDYAIVVNEQLEFAYRECIAALIKIGRYDRAFCYLEEYVDRFKPDAGIYVDMGLCMSQAGRHLEARDCYAKALRTDAYNSKVYYYMGLSYCETDSTPSRALKMFSKALDLDAGDWHSCLALARCHDNAGEFALSHSYYQRAIELAPEEAIVWLDYIECLIDDFQYKDALQIAQQARDYCSDPQLACAQAAIYFLIGRRMEGFRCLEEVVRKNLPAALKLFDIAPGLENDESIREFLSTCRG